jgi:hypothetical protein
VNTSYEEDISLKMASMSLQWLSPSSKIFMVQSAGTDRDGIDG